jgi:hypothetical protein
MRLLLLVLDHLFLGLYEEFLKPRVKLIIPEILLFLAYLQALA